VCIGKARYSGRFHTRKIATASSPILTFLTKVALNTRSPGLTSRHALPLRIIVPRFAGTPSTFVFGFANLIPLFGGILPCGSGWRKRQLFRAVIFVKNVPNDGLIQISYRVGIISTAVICRHLSLFQDSRSYEGWTILLDL